MAIEWLMPTKIKYEDKFTVLELDADPGDGHLKLAKIMFHGGVGYVRSFIVDCCEKVC